MKIFFLALLLIVHGFLVAGNSKADSLKQQLLSLQGYERYDALIKLTKEYLYRQPDEAMIYAKEASDVAENDGKIKESLTAKEYIGISNLVMGNYDTALIILSQMLNDYKDLDDEASTGKIHNLLGSTYSSMDEHDLSLNHYLKSLQVNEKHKNKAGEANNYNNLGTLYYKIGNNNKALDYFKKALIIYEKNQPDGNNFGSVADISRPVGNISVIYKELEKFDSALIFAERALELNKETGNDYGVAGTMNNIGYIYDGMQQYSLAIQAYKQSLEINKRVNDNWSIANTNANIANSYIASGNYVAAETYLDQALLVASEINAKDVLIFIYESFSKLYKNKGLYKNSLEYYTKMSELKDSVFTEEKNNQITEMQTKYETEKKEKENLALKKDNEIQQLKLSQNRTIINSMTLGIMVVVILLMVIYISYRRQTIAYKNLVKKNLELAHCDRRILEKGEFISEKIIETDNMDESVKELKLIESFNKYLTEEKPYLYNNISLDEISAKLGTNRTYLSKAINSVYSKSFNTLINEFRIRAARQLLTDKKYDHISLEGIGEMVGYNSRIVFYKNFKKVTGLTPSYFKASIS